MSYGLHYREIAGALAWLLNHRTRAVAVVPEDGLPRVLTCRAALLDAQQALLEQAIRGADVDHVLFGRSHTTLRNLSLHDLAIASPVVLAELLDQVPRHRDHLLAPTDALLTQTDGSQTPAVAAWQHAGRHATLAADTLTTARNSPDGWVTLPGQAWRVVADVATTVQALAVLDRRLALNTRRLLPWWDRTHRRQLPELRMIAAQTAALARSGPLDPATDTRDRNEAGDHPVVISRLDQLPTGIRAAATLATRSLPTIHQLRSICLAHADIARTCAELLPADAGLDDLRHSFTNRADRYRAVAAATVRVTSLPVPAADRAGGQALLAQTGEIHRIVTGASRHPDHPALAGVLADTDQHQPALAAALSVAITQAFDTGRYLVADHSALGNRWQPANVDHPIRARLETAAGQLRHSDLSADQRKPSHPIGRAPAMTPTKIAAARQLLKTGTTTKKQIAANLGVGLSTLKRALHPDPNEAPPEPPAPISLGPTRLEPAHGADAAGQTTGLTASQDDINPTAPRPTVSNHPDPATIGSTDPARAALADAVTGQQIGRPHTPSTRTTQPYRPRRQQTRRTAPPTP